LILLVVGLLGLAIISHKRLGISGKVQLIRDDKAQLNAR
jgi:hypothetical protein